MPKLAFIQKDRFGRVLSSLMDPHKFIFFIFTTLINYSLTNMFIMCLASGILRRRLLSSYKRVLGGYILRPITLGGRFQIVSVTWCLMDSRYIYIHIFFSFNIFNILYWTNYLALFTFFLFQTLCTQKTKYNMTIAITLKKWATTYLTS